MKNLLKITVFVFVFLLLNFTIYAQAVEGAYFTLDNCSAGWAYSILNETIFDVFTKDLDSKDYNTDLKKKIFLDSDAAKVYISRLNELKNQIRTQGIKYTIPKQNVSISDYDLRNKGFWLQTGQNHGMGTVDASYKFTIGNFLYEKLPITEESISFLGPKYLNYKILLPIKEEIAVKVEGNKNLGVRLEMKISGLTEKKFNFYNYNGRGYELTQKYPTATSMKIILFDVNTNEIFGEFNY